MTDLRQAYKSLFGKELGKQLYEENQKTLPMKLDLLKKGLCKTGKDLDEWYKKYGDYNAR